MADIQCADNHVLLPIASNCNVCLLPDPLCACRFVAVTFSAAKFSWTSIGKRCPGVARWVCPQPASCECITPQRTISHTQTTHQPRRLRPPTCINVPPQLHGHALLPHADAQHLRGVGRQPCSTRALPQAPFPYSQRVTRLSTSVRCNLPCFVVLLPLCSCGVFKPAVLMLSRTHLNNVS